MSNACSSLVNGVCIDGFMATPWCNPVGTLPHKCFSCGRDYDGQPTPRCMSEKALALDFPETGTPSWEQVQRARIRAAAPAKEGE